MSSDGILQEQKARWKIENGIKDLVDNYFSDNIPGIDPHRINIHYFVVTLAPLLYEMLSQDYEIARNPDSTKRQSDSLRSEFMTGSNAVLSTERDQLVVQCKDSYPEKQHQALEALFEKLNREANQGLAFLGGLGLRFELASPRTTRMRNQLKRAGLEI